MLAGPERLEEVWKAYGFHTDVRLDRRSLTLLPNRGLIASPPMP